MGCRCAQRAVGRRTATARLGNARGLAWARGASRALARARTVDEEPAPGKGGAVGNAQRRACDGVDARGRVPGEQLRQRLQARQRAKLRGRGQRDGRRGVRRHGEDVALVHAQLQRRAAVGDDERQRRQRRRCSWRRKSRKSRRSRRSRRRRVREGACEEPRQASGQVGRVRAGHCQRRRHCHGRLAGGHRPARRRPHRQWRLCLTGRRRRRRRRRRSRRRRRRRCQQQRKQRRYDTSLRGHWRSPRMQPPYVQSAQLGRDDTAQDSFATMRCARRRGLCTGAHCTARRVCGARAEEASRRAPTRRPSTRTTASIASSRL